jgi:hypothetical protein
MFADFVSLAVDDDVNLYREILVVYWTCLRLEGLVVDLGLKAIANCS